MRHPIISSHNSHISHYSHVAVALLVFCAATATAAPSAGPQPYIGYAYPAGGQQGAVFSITLGGENLKDASDVYVTGEGVRASVTAYEGPTGPLTQPQFQTLRSQLEDRRDKLMAARGANNGAAQPGKDSAAPDAAKTDAAKRQAVELPDIPELKNVDQMNFRQLRAVAEKYIKPYAGPKRLKPPLAERVTLQITIAAGAAPGDRELRLRTPQGVTNPLVFQVGRWPEVRSQPPSGDATTAVNPPVDLPAVLNGQILPGQVHRFPFKARRGQKLVITVAARRLIPYLADAVPGWFQAVVTLNDAKGDELAVADHYRFEQDPVLFYEVPEDGEYSLEINDSLYRGRQDFVYRVAIGEQPFITQMFPLGGKAGTPTTASIAGWNLPEQQLTLDTQPGAGRLRHVAWRGQEQASNELPYAVDALPESEAIESPSTAQDILPPRIINGRIAHPGDTAIFRFEGRAGEEMVAEVYARRLGSPLDSLLRLTDSSGKVLAWNDDFEDPASGLLTHQADSYLRTKLPADGTYEVHLTDAQGDGSDAHAYRLRIGPPRPNFLLFVTPSGINIGAGHAAPICIHAVRRDGFDGEIEVALKPGQAEGFSLAGGRIPGGRDHVYMTLKAPRAAADQLVALQFEGRAQIGGATVTRQAIPADDMMQAFAYQHLVPARQLMVAVTETRRWQPVFTLASSGPVYLPAGGAVQVRAVGPPRAAGGEVELELSDPPKGVTLTDVTAVSGGVEFMLKADAGAPVGYADNLIVEASVQSAARANGQPALAQKRRVPLGVLPAIPFEIVRPN